MILFVCSFHTKLFFAGGAKTFSMDETDSIVLFLDAFYLKKNTINQITTKVLLNYYISNQLDHSPWYLFCEDNG